MLWNISNDPSNDPAFLYGDFNILHNPSGYQGKLEKTCLMSKVKGRALLVGKTYVKPSIKNQLSLRIQVCPKNPGFFRTFTILLGWDWNPKHHIRSEGVAGWR